MLLFNDRSNLRGVDILHEYADSLNRTRNCVVRTPTTLIVSLDFECLFGRTQQDRRIAKARRSADMRAATASKSCPPKRRGGIRSAAALRSAANWPLTTLARLNSNARKGREMSRRPASFEGLALSASATRKRSHDETPRPEKPAARLREALNGHPLPYSFVFGWFTANTAQQLDRLTRVARNRLRCAGLSPPNECSALSPPSARLPWSIRW
jgi:hypothetical protein